VPTIAAINFLIILFLLELLCLELVPYSVIRHPRLLSCTNVACDCPHRHRTCLNRPHIHLYPAAVVARPEHHCSSSCDITVRLLTHVLAHPLTNARSAVAAIVHVPNPMATVATAVTALSSWAPCRRFPLRSGCLIPPLMPYDLSTRLPPCLLHLA
jgi:hypothetical protein